MNDTRPYWRRCMRPQSTDQGFTLIELVMALVLSGLIAGVIVAAMVTSLNIADSTTAQVHDSTDIGLVSAFLYRDAQAAGGVDPTTARLYPGLGVSTTDPADCMPPGALKVRFSWIDRPTVGTEHTLVASYGLQSNGQMTRRLCQDGALVADVVVGRSVSAATASCLSAPPVSCAGLPDAVQLIITGSGTRSPITSTMTAALRPEDQSLSPITLTNASMVSLLALGDLAGSASCPVLSVAGTSTVTVIGDAVASAGCGASAISDPSSHLSPLAPGSTSISDHVNNPFATLGAPAGTCPGSGSNAPTIGSHNADPTVATIYPAAVVISTAVTFAPGRYVFCQGLAVNAGGAAVAPSGVFFYIAGGTLSVDPLATIDLHSMSSGPYANVLAWIASPQTISLRAGPRPGSYRGFVYAPTSAVTITATAAAIATNIGGLIARAITVTDSNIVRFGPVPNISISPATLPSGIVGTPYSATLSAVGEVTGAVRWSASGLPAPLIVNAQSGGISGTPACSGTSSVIATALDATNAAASATYQLAIDPFVALTPPANFVRDTVTLAATISARCDGVVPSATFQYYDEPNDVWVDLCTDGTVPYTCAWVTTDTSKFNNGESYSLRIVSSDGTISDQVDGILIDNGNPTVTLTVPSGTLQGLVTLKADATDGESGIASVVFQYSTANAGPWTNICTKTTPFSLNFPDTFTCDWDTTVVAAGSYFISAVASDRVAPPHTSTSVVANKPLNNSQGSVALVDPGPYIRGTTTLQAVGFMPSPVTITSVDIQYKVGNAWTTICTDASAPYSCDWNTSLRPDGLVTLRATMLDSIGATTTSAEITTTIDNTLMRATDVQAINKYYALKTPPGSPKGTPKVLTFDPGKVNSPDELTLTYSKPVDPNSLITGWNGASIAIFVRLIDGYYGGLGSSTDYLDFCTTWASGGMSCSGNGAWNDGANIGKGTGIGSINLRANFVDGGPDKNGIPKKQAAILRATISVSGNTVKVVMVGPGWDKKNLTYSKVNSSMAQNSPKDSRKITTLANMIWLPSGSARDTIGNVCSTAAAGETGILDLDF